MTGVHKAEEAAAAVSKHCRNNCKRELFALQVKKPLRRNPESNAEK